VELSNKITAAIYCRVSTDVQELEQQTNACIKYCEMKEYEYIVYTETMSSTKERPVFQEVMHQCLARHFKVLLVFRFDRAWRSSRQFIMDFDALRNQDINVVSVMEGLDTTTPMGKAMVTILVALAELERVNISQATKHRLQALKNMGKKLGRPKGSKDKAPRPKTGYLLREANKRGLRKPLEKQGEIKNDV